jgi:phospholipase/carboxylesterase
MSTSSPEPSASISLDGWTFRQRLPSTAGLHPVIVMLHGWTGDENAMWIFSGRLPQNALLIAPRGLHPTPMGGYGWHPHKAEWPGVDDFRPAVQGLLDFLTPQNFPQADLTQFYLLGFSQGAALAFSLALLYPERVGAVAGLSGFLPEGAAALSVSLPLKKKPVFMAHGTLDELVPVVRARQAVALLQQAGAQVDYCEDNVGHKLSATCFRSMQVFFEDVIPAET